MAIVAPKIILINQVYTEANNPFPDEVLNTLAKSILAGGGLINPLIVKRRGYEDYDLVDGKLQYFAAKLAAQIDPIRGESIDAYIIEEDNADVIQQQMDIFRTPQPDLGTVTISMQQLEQAIESVTQPLLEKINYLENQFVGVFSALQRIEKKLEPKPRLEPKPEPELKQEPESKSTWINELNRITPQELAVLVKKSGKSINKNQQSTLIKKRPFQQEQDITDLQGISSKTLENLQEIFKNYPSENKPPEQTDSTAFHSEDLSTEPVALHTPNQVIAKHEPVSKTQIRSEVPKQQATTEPTAPSATQQNEVVPKAPVSGSQQPTAPTKPTATVSDPILERINAEDEKELVFKLTRAKIPKSSIKAILQQRPFSSLQEIKKIKGLGKSSFEKVIDLMTK